MRKNLLKKVVLLLVAFIGTTILSAQTMPTISTVGNEVWYYIQFTTGKAVIQDMGNGQKVITKDAAKNKDAQLWKITGTQNNYVLTNKLGHSLKFNGSRFVATSGTGDKFKIIHTTYEAYKNKSWMLQRIGGSGQVNQFGGQGPNKELGEWNNLGDHGSCLEFTPPTDLSFKPEKPDSEVTFSGEGSNPLPKYSLWYRRPAKEWMTHALPIGNGEFGGMIFGGVKQEEIQFNDKSLWTGSPSKYGAYQNFGSLFINHVGVTKAKDYVRGLDIENAIATVQYETDNVKYTREFFSSRPDNSIVVHYESTGTDNLNLEVMLWGAHSEKLNYENGTIWFEGKLDILNYYAKAVVKHEGGTLVTENDKIKISGANTVTVILRGKTNYDPASPTYMQAPSTAKTETEAILTSAKAKDYASLKSAHTVDYKSLFDRVEFELEGTKNTIPTDDLINEYNSKGYKNLFLEELYFHYGRYLLISSSRGMDSPANLQGIWNHKNDPPWHSDIHSNINVQMNYWPSEITNLSELHMPFLNHIYYESMLHDNWKNNAKESGQTKGWTLYTENNIFGSNGGFMKNYVIANAWYSTHLWQHYRFTLDEDYLLNKAYPSMKSCAEYWMERLIEAQDGTLECPNEYSPEHGPARENGTAHAQQLVWDLFNNTLKAIEVLGNKISDDAFKTELKAKFAKLDNGLRIEKSTGLLREWKYSPSSVGARGHRHMSHLMALYPGNQISPLINQEMFDAAVKSLEDRGDVSTGWSMGWKINLWARALDGTHARVILNKALRLSHSIGNNAGDGGIYQNLFDSHAPFQIDGNFGATAGITEMLLQSHLDILQLAPALPKAWKKGHMKGLRATNLFEVELKWDESRMTETYITSLAGKKCVVYYPGIKNGKVLNKTTGEDVAFTEINDNQIEFPTVKDNVYTVVPPEACKNPVFSPEGGLYTTIQPIEITTATSGATIYYTLDGTEPNENSLVYTGAINIDEPTTIKAIAMKDGLASSEVVTESYVMGDYMTNLKPTIKSSRQDRRLNTVKFTGDNNGTLDGNLPSQSPQFIYNNLTDEVVGYATPGETLTPTMSYSTGWMHGYVYFDFGNDGVFTFTVNTDGTPAANSDVVSYSYYNGKNSLGEVPTSQPVNNPGVNSPAFTLPNDIEYGVYRMRYKVDWDNIDAGGRTIKDNNIVRNGGAIADVLVNIHKPNSMVKVNTQNGKVENSDNSVLANTEIPFGQAREILLTPNANYKLKSLKIKHGYLTKEEFIHHNRQWKVDEIDLSKVVDNKFTIPATMIDGDVLIIVEFTNISGVDDVLDNSNILLSVAKNKLSVKTLSNQNVVINDVLGRTFFNGSIDGEQTFNLKTGVYFVNRMKIFIP